MQKYQVSGIVVGPACKNMALRVPCLAQGWPKEAYQERLPLNVRQCIIVLWQSVLRAFEGLSRPDSILALMMSHEGN